MENFAEGKYFLLRVWRNVYRPITGFHIKSHRTKAEWIIFANAKIAIPVQNAASNLRK